MLQSDVRCQRRKKVNTILKMPAFCTAANCTARQGSGNVSLHPFPHNRPDILRKWVRFVQCKRADFDVPTKHSNLCSDHFVEADFLNFAQFKAGFAKKFVLNRSAVSSVNKRPANPKTRSPDPATNDVGTGETKRLTSLESHNNHVQNDQEAEEEDYPFAKQYDEDWQMESETGDESEEEQTENTRCK